MSGGGGRSMGAALTVWFSVCLFGCWLVLTAAAQLPSRFASRVERLDECALIPNWRFFAPRPACTDFHLLFRDRLASGAHSAWREPAELRSRRTPWHAVWHPEKRL